MKIVVIIPTYNEAGAIKNVLNELLATTEVARKHEWHALVVDGNSSDGTQEIVEEYVHRFPSIHLLKETEKRGLALAYLAGMTHAIRILGADAYVEFDGDGQHDPAFLPAMADTLEAGADYAIGSRYIEGGSVPKEWKLYSRLLSRLGSLYSRILLELPVHDVTSGFKMTRVKGFADKLPLQEGAFLTRHYAYKIQLLNCMHKLGARMVEVPIVFRHREQGTSKSTWRDIIESLKVTAILRIQDIHSWRLPRVLLIGGTGFILQSIIFEILGIQLKVVSASTAALIGGEIAILSNFFLNNRFSFRDRSAEISSLLSRLFKFHIVSSGSVAIQWLLIFSVEQFTTDALILRGAFFLGIGLGFITNYLGYYFWVWRERA